MSAKLSLYHRSDDMQFKAILKPFSALSLGNIARNDYTADPRFISGHAISDITTTSGSYRVGDDTVREDSRNIEPFREPQDRVACAVFLLLLLGTGTVITWICGILVDEIFANLMSVNTYELVNVLSGIS